MPLRKQIRGKGSEFHSLCWENVTFLALCVIGRSDDPGIKNSTILTDYQGDFQGETPLNRCSQLAAVSCQLRELTELDRMLNTTIKPRTLWDVA